MEKIHITLFTSKRRIGDRMKFKLFFTTINRNYLLIIPFLLFFCVHGNTAIQDRNVVIVIFDGASTQAVEKMVAQGKMPVLKNMMENGSYVKAGTSILPSTTGPAYAPFVMGLFPDKSLLPGIRWYDRVKGIYRTYCGTDAMKMNEDVSKKFPTIYELLGNEHTLSVFGFITRGCKATGMPLFQMLKAKLQKNDHNLDNSLFDSFRKNVEKKFPRFAFISLHSIDSNGHSKGANSDEYYKSLTHCDGILGKIMDLYKKMGEFDKTVFIVSSDHGQRAVNRRKGLKPFLDLKNLRVVDSVARSTIKFNFLKNKIKNNSDCVLAVSGNAFVQLYFKDQVSKKMEIRPGYEQLRNYPVPRIIPSPLFVAEDNVNTFYPTENIDLVEELLKIESVNLVFLKDQEKAHVFNKTGHSIITRNGTTYSYTLADGSDPLRYTIDAKAALLVGNKFYNIDHWLAATVDSDYPDGIVQISRFLDTPGSGDIVVNSALDYEPWCEGQKGLHGGLERSEILVPIIFYGADIKKTVIPYARTVDIFPVVLKIFGLISPPNIDGKELPVFIETKSLKKAQKF